MKTQVQEIARKLPDLSTKEPVLVAIDGCGGAGKSSFASELALELKSSQVVHIDDFYKPKERRVEVTTQRSVHVNFELDRLKQQVLEPLKRGSVVRYQTASGETVEVKPSGYVIVEGLGTLGNELKSYFDYKIWVDAPESTRRQRGIERDSEAWTAIWDNEYLPQDARYIREQSPQKEADWVINNH